MGAGDLLRAQRVLDHGQHRAPGAALHLIRLDHVRDELRHRGDMLSTAVIAQRYGFTNPARFAVAYW